MADSILTPTDTPLTWQTTKPRSFWGDALYKFTRNWVGMLGLLVFILLWITAIFAPQLAPYDYLAQDWEALLKPPGAAHWMGTDDVGRDVFSRVLMGGRTAMMVALGITATGGVIGLLIGSFGAFIGGKLDAALVWIMDGLLSFPGIWLAAFINVAVTPAIKNWANALYAFAPWPFLKDDVLLSYGVVVFSVGMMNWAWLARVVRSQVLSLREQEFIEAARALGASAWWITLRHLIPNVLGVVIVYITLSFGNALLFESSLSFLGIGIRPPGASWGAMIFQGIGRVRSHPYLVLAPGLTLAVVALSLQFLGDALNDALNPKSRS